MAGDWANAQDTIHNDVFEYEYDDSGPYWTSGVRRVRNLGVRRGRGRGRKKAAFAFIICSAARERLEDDFVTSGGHEDGNLRLDYFSVRCTDIVSRCSVRLRADNELARADYLDPNAVIAMPDKGNFANVDWNVGGATFRINHYGNPYVRAGRPVAGKRLRYRRSVKKKCRESQSHQQNKKGAHGGVHIV